MGKVLEKLKESLNERDFYARRGAGFQAWDALRDLIARLTRS